MLPKAPNILYIFFPLSNFALYAVILYVVDGIVSYIYRENLYYFM